MLNGSNEGGQRVIAFIWPGALIVETVASWTVIKLIRAREARPGHLIALQGVVGLAIPPSAVIWGICMINLRSTSRVGLDAFDRRRPPTTCLPWSTSPASGWTAGGAGPP